MDWTDPDTAARLLVMQWMQESGYHDALKVLEKEAGVIYDDSQTPEASELMQLVWRAAEAKQREADEEAEGSASRAAEAAARREEALALLRAGRGDYAGPAVVADVAAASGLHPANIIGVRLVPGREELLTASSDGVVRCVTFGGQLCWATRLGAAPLLCLALHPLYGSGLALVAVGAMDGSVTVLHGPTGATVATAKAHAKYVVRVAWAGPDGGGGDAPSEAAAGAPVAGAAPAPPLLLLATASTDETVGIHVLELPGLAGAVCGPPAAAAGDQGARQAGGEAAGTGGSAAAAADAAAAAAGALTLGSLSEEQMAGAGQLSTVQQVPYAAAVADVAWLPPAAAPPAAGGRPGPTLLVGVRGSNYLRALDAGPLARRLAALRGTGQALGAVAAQAPPLPEARINLNEAGDDHVSFSPKQLLPSHCGRYLLVLTDTPRMPLLRTADWSHARTLHGPPAESFPQPVAAWHRDGAYVYAAGAGAQVCVLHVGSGRLVHTAAPHRINVRDLHYDPDRNLLATCSFDKSVKVLGQGPEPPGPEAQAEGEAPPPPPHHAAA